MRGYSGAADTVIMSDRDAPDGLQFETAVPHAAPADAVTKEQGSVTCRACERTITDEYFDINGQPVCDSCRVRIEEQAETPKGWGVFARARTPQRLRTDLTFFVARRARLDFTRAVSTRAARTSDRS